jgi:lysyl-tRNA synthetase class 1
MERVVYGLEGENEEKRAAFRRIYELAQINFDGKMPDQMPIQPSFRHLCTNLCINELNIEKTRAAYAGQIKNDADERRFAERAKRAVFWMENYADSDFKFILNTGRRADLQMSEQEAAFVSDIRKMIEIEWNDFADDRDLQTRIGAVMERYGLESADAYKLLYQLLISRDKGPKLAHFILSIGKDKILNLL